MENAYRRYAYHDPCYLGRHNGIYDDPAPGHRRHSGDQAGRDDGDCRDRSFCCGGGGLMLFYEPEEEQRMGVVRVQMAAEAGADVIVTACPSAWSTSRTRSRWPDWKARWTAIDLCELVDRQLQRGT